jgi:hypothetical protein
MTLPTLGGGVLGVMRLRAVLAIAILAALSSTGFAADKDKGSALTSYQLGDYSLGLDTDDPNKPDPAAPPGLVTLRQETIRPFVGLKLSTPLTTHFWSVDQDTQKPVTPKKAKAGRRKSVKRKQAVQHAAH